MPGNLRSRVEQELSLPSSDPSASSSRRRDKHNDNRQPLRHALSVDSISRPETSRKMTHKRSFARSKPKPAKVTPDEFNALPTSIQMKYFSPVERLHIAQEAARQMRKQQSAQEAKLSAHRPATGYRSESISSVPPARRPQSAHAHSHAASFSTSKQTSLTFTTDNGVTIEPLRHHGLSASVDKSSSAPRQASQAADISPRALRQTAPRPHLSNPRICLSGLRKGSADSTEKHAAGSHAILGDETEKTWLDTDASSIRSVESSSTVEGIFRLYAQRRQPPTTALPSAVPPQPQLPSAPLPPQVPSFQRKRSIALTPLRLPPPTLLPAVPALPSPTTLQNMTKAVRSYSNVSASSAPSLSTHDHKESSMRAKLREHRRLLGQSEHAIQLSPSRSEPRLASPESRRAFFDSAASDHGSDVVRGDGSSEEDDDDDDVDDVSSAITPSAPSIRSNSHDATVIHCHTADSDLMLPLSSKMSAGKASIRSLSPDVTFRELRLPAAQLKPELRAPEDELYSNQRKQVSGVDLDKDGALKLQEIMVCDDHSGSQGAFAVGTPITPKSATFLKVWKNITRR